MAGLFLKKPITQIRDECGRSELNRSLSVYNLISMGIGCIIGAGIFSMTGHAIADYAGPAIIISFVLAGIACAFAALCYAELASMLPVSGSAYTYAYASLGEVIAWTMGWLLVLEYGAAASVVAVSWSGYFVSLMANFGWNIPPEWANAPAWGDTTAVQGIFNLPAFLSLMALTVLLMLGVKESATANNITVFIKLTVIVLFIAFGFFYINPENWHPFIPDPMPDPNPDHAGQTIFGWPGILHGAATMSFAYVGFEAVSTAAQEAKNPERDVPIGILGALGICTVLYMLVALVLTGLVSYKSLGVPDPLALAVDVIGLKWLTLTVKVGAVIGMLSVMLVLLYGQTRVFYSMARDGMIPNMFCVIHMKWKTPWINTLVAGTLMSILAGITPIEKLGDMVNLGTLAAFGIICYSVMYLRKHEPDLPRQFKVPFYPLTPILGIITCLGLMWSLRSMIAHLMAYFILGAAVYAFYSYRNSTLRKGQSS